MSKESNLLFERRKMTKGPQDFARYWSILFVIILTVPLVAYTYMGSFMRYSGDDYCYAWILGQNGFWKAQVSSYLHVSMYNGNRYSLTLFSGLADLFGPGSSRLVSGLVILSWVLGLALVFRQLARQRNLSGNWLQVCIGAEFLSLWTLLQAPDLYQILYWRTGMLTYLAPLVTNAFLFGLILWQWNKQRTNWLAMVLAFILAIVAGGFSETGFAMQMTYLVMLSVYAIILMQTEFLLGRRILGICGAALLGTGLAGILLAISPTNLDRVANLPPRPDFASLIQSTLENLRIFSVITIKSLFLSSLVGFIVSCGLGIIFYTRHSSQKADGLSYILVKFSLVIILGFLLLCACFMPSAYIQSSYPGLRALIAARFVMVLIIVLIGWLVGQAAVRLLGSGLANTRSVLVVSIGIFLVAGICISTTIPSILADQSKFQRWALRWDERDFEIRTASLQNVNNVEVMQLDHLIPDVGELSPDPEYWYNQCAAGYYKVDKILANQPGWDE